MGGLSASCIPGSQSKERLVCLASLALRRCIISLILRDFLRHHSYFGKKRVSAFHAWFVLPLPRQRERAKKRPGNITWTTYLCVAGTIFALICAVRVRVRSVQDQFKSG